MITLYIIGQKGYDTLVKLFETYSGSIIKNVIVSNDNGVDNDYSDKIKIFSKK